MMGAFAAIALAMAVVSIYGLIACLAGRRTHELGVRMALGTRRREVLLLVLSGSMRMVLAGVRLGYGLCIEELPFFRHGAVTFSIAHQLSWWRHGRLKTSGTEA